MKKRTGLSAKAPMLAIGGNVSEVLVKDILKILEMPHADEATKQKALDVLAKLGVVDSVTVQNCTFTDETK